MVNDNQDDWDQFIDSTLFSIRVKKQMTTKFTPFYLMYHREAKVPTQISMPQPVLPVSLLGMARSKQTKTNLIRYALKSLCELASVSHDACKKVAASSKHLPTCTDSSSKQFFMLQDCIIFEASLLQTFNFG